MSKISVAKTVWFFGLPGAGKSTLADAIHGRFVEWSIAATRLDGDLLRQRLNSDLGFSGADRRENIRRAAEVARLFNQAGMTVVASFISPRRCDRQMARDIIGPARLIEVFVDAPLAVCEARDPKGLYRRARAGHVQAFTGVSAEFEPPEGVDLRVDSAATRVDEAVALLAQALLPMMM